MACFSIMDFSQSSSLLFCPASSAAPQGTSRGGSLHDTCGMEIDAGCKDRGWCEPSPMGMLELGSFLKRPCSQHPPAAGEGVNKTFNNPKPHIYLLSPSLVNTKISAHWFTSTSSLLPELIQFHHAHPLAPCDRCPNPTSP